jgi:hypothetical protein
MSRVLATLMRAVAHDASVVTVSRSPAQVTDSEEPMSVNVDSRLGHDDVTEAPTRRDCMVGRMRHRLGVWVGAFVWVVVSASAGSAVLAQGDETASARTWLEEPERFEAFIRTAEVEGIEDIGIGVTDPKRADLEPGGPVERIAFKPIRPGNYNGHRESYLSEIAAYALDKLLELGMIPPTVEKRIAGDVGAAVMWVAPTQSFKDLGGAPSPPSTAIGRWNYQIIRAKMFHNLIYNKDPNQGNWLVDPAWNVILIDNSRAFTPVTRMTHEMIRIDRELWGRFLALHEAVLEAALGEWLGGREIRGILERRDHMAEVIEVMVAERGESAVFIEFGER